MNRLLSKIVGGMNALIAIIFVLVGAAVGYILGRGDKGLIVGGAAGLLVAALVCGGLALIIEIRGELVPRRA